jgi:putative tricarboxylic transport membrane protein
MAAGGGRVTADRLVAVILLVWAVVYIRVARGYHGLTVADILGPSAYPYLIGGLMALAAVALFAQSRPRPVEGTFWSRHGRPLLLAAFLYAYIRLLDPIGFLLSTVAFITLGHRWLGERSWVKSAALAAGVTLALWYVFNQLFALNLPAGFLGWPR